MIRVAVNGFGRIGKCVFLQLLKDPKFQIVAVNASNLVAKEMEDYLVYDTNHRHGIPITVTVLSETEVQVNSHHITLIKERDPKKIDWRGLGCEYLIDATGAFVTMEKCRDHNAPYTIISSPAKDAMPTFIYSVNHEKYHGETIVSGSSCTTNCLSPVLRILNDAYRVKDVVFTTIHAATASQYVEDSLQKGARTDRSVFNNIIPHTTGASSSVTAVLPELRGKVYGTSVRVPVSNCSLVDVNVELEDHSVKLQDIQRLLETSPYFGTVYGVTSQKLVSGDFATTTTPSILDLGGCIDMGNGKFKLFIWYDNEWSYSAQLIRVVESMFEFNNK